MTLYSKWFNAHSEYETYKNSLDYILPNVSYCVDLNELHFEKQVRDYSNEYLTFEALEDTEFSIFYSTEKQFITREMRESFSYSIDNGETWVTFTAPNDYYEGTALTTPTIHQGEKVLWKGIGNRNDNNGQFCNILATGNFIAYGNIMSLNYGDNFRGVTDLSNTISAFANLFTGNSKLINALNLILPATTLGDYCYNSLFLSCTNLTAAPELPATILADYCYASMFHTCDYLTTAPELPATILADHCYASMFNTCVRLTAAPELPATTLADHCYNSMFMFCVNMTNGPELPATTLVDHCYNSMFWGCEQLNYIKAMFTTTPETLYTSSWVNDVASTGTFVKNSAATWDVNGVDGIPEGWTVQTANA